MPPPNRIVGLGASTMEGVGDSEGGFLRRVSRHPQVAKLGIAFHNAGVGGDTVADMQARLPRITPLRPYDLVVLLGSNDLPRPNDPNPEKRPALADFAKRVRHFLEAARGERSLFVSSFAVAESTGIPRTLCRAYAAAALEEAAAANFDIVDLYRDSLPLLSQLLRPDGIHFNDAGHAFIAERVLPWVAARPRASTRA